MKKLLLNAVFVFPKWDYWMDSSINWVVENISNLEELKTYIEENQYIQLYKSKPEFIYNNDKPCGYFFKFKTEENWEIFKGELWLEINEVKDFDFKF